MMETRVEARASEETGARDLNIERYDALTNIRATQKEESSIHIIE